MLCRCDDEQEYWCKSFEPGINEDTAVNEIVSAEVGRAIGAPVCEWAIVNPEEFARTSFEGKEISDAPLFWIACGSDCTREGYSGLFEP